MTVTHARKGYTKRCESRKVANSQRANACRRLAAVYVVEPAAWVSLGAARRREDHATVYTRKVCRCCASRLLSASLVVE